MARGNQIIVTADPKGRFLSGLLSASISEADPAGLVPGTLMQQDTTAPDYNGFRWKPLAPGTDGLKCLIAVLLEDEMQGFTITSAYTAGTPCKLYCPLPGEEFNALVGEVAGTGNTVAVSARFIVDAEDGVFVPETGSPQSTDAISCEAFTQQAPYRLTWLRKL